MSTESPPLPPENQPPTPPVGPTVPPLAAGPRPVAPSAPAARKTGKGCGFWVLACLVVLFFGSTMILLLVVAGMAFSGAGFQVETSDTGLGRNLVERTLEGKGDNKILLIPISGIIMDLPEESLFRSGPSMTEQVREMLKAARRDGAVKAVLLEIDSPGGGVTASDVLNHELSAFHEQTGIPVVAHMGDVAASGGYYVAAAAQHIVAHPTTVTGSIGVVMPLIGIEDLLTKIGVKSRPIKSGEFKDIGSMSRDMTAEERAMLQGIVNEYYQRFVTVVYDGFQGRGVKITRAQLEKYCDGRVLTGKQAKALGFVDEIGYAEDAIRAACQKAGISVSEARVITYQRKPGLLDLLFARLSSPKPEAVTIRLEGLTPQARTRFMYLWTVGAPAATP